MKRSLIILLIVIVLAGYLGTLIARDPGYVLVTYDGYSLQTSLWVLLGLLTGLSLGVYLLIRAFKILQKSGAVYQGWRAEHQTERASQLTEKGLVLLAEGEFERARKFLDSGADNNKSRGLNYLAAARAANDTGDHESRETYLRLSEEADGNLARARGVVTAELALARNDPDVALAALKNIKQNRHVASLKQKALRQRNNWQDMIAALPELRQFDATGAIEMEREAALLGLQAQSGNDDSLNSLFKSLLPELKHCPLLLGEYVRALQNKSHAEPVLRAAIKKSWQPELVELYGDSDYTSLKTRKKTTQGWLKQHPDDASLQFCLGCLDEISGENSLARDHFNQCIDLGGTRRANEKLALLLAKTGEFERSHEQLRLAMGLTD